MNASIAASAQIAGIVQIGQSIDRSLVTWGDEPPTKTPRPEPGRFSG